MQQTETGDDVDLIGMLTLRHVRAVREAFWVGLMIGMCALLILLCCGQWIVHDRHVMALFLTGRAG